MKKRKAKALYVIVWRYRVRRAAEKRFERIYGPRGAWARLFRKSRGYFGTQLLREAEGEVRRGAQSRSKGGRRRGGARYVTIDMWRSRAAFEAFHRRHHGAYQRIDHLCESLTLQEEKLGAWTR